MDRELTPTERGIVFGIFGRVVRFSAELDRLTEHLPVVEGDDSDQKQVLFHTLCHTYDRRQF
jgi:hypothetical protein